MFSCGCTFDPINPAISTVRFSLSNLLCEQGEDDAFCTQGYEEEEVYQSDIEEAARQREQQLLERDVEQARHEAQTCREPEDAEEQFRREYWQAMERKRHELEQAEEQRQRDFEQRERAEKAQQMEMERLTRERERKELIAIFLKDHGYSDVATPKRTMWRTKYPIHTAAQTGDSQIVAALLQEGANPVQADSVGQTAAQIAKLRNRDGSHANVLRALGGA